MAEIVWEREKWAGTTLCGKRCALYRAGFDPSCGFGFERDNTDPLMPGPDCPGEGTYRLVPIETKIETPPADQP